MKRRPLLFFSALSALLFSCVVHHVVDPNDGPGGSPEPEPEPDAPDKPDERSKARKFLDALRSKEFHAADNARLRKELAALQQQTDALMQDVGALAGAAEAAEETSRRLAEVEITLGMKSGTLGECEVADIRAAVDAAVQRSAAEDIAKSGVPCL
nr:hypothetical protein [Verrucomicrobiales bacterium]